MPFTDRPVKVNIREGHTNIEEFLLDVMRIMDKIKPYGMYVVLFTADNEGEAHGYQFGLREDDYDLVGMIANEHRKLDND